MNTKIAEAEIVESLSRSGYLFESEIISKLSKLNYFVESNIPMLDPSTLKTREIDLTAEYSHPERNGNYEIVMAHTKFVFEIKNNDNFPLVLLTKYEHSPNVDIWDALKVSLSLPLDLENYFFDNFFDALVDLDSPELYTQYCSFMRKKDKEKNELMAYHPEILYSGLLKLGQYCEQKNGYRISDWFRSHLHLPVVLLNDDLYEFEIDSTGKNNLRKVDCSKLLFSYHFEDRPRQAIIYIVTKAGLDDFLIKIRDAEELVKKNMLDARERAENDKKNNKNG